MLEGCVGPTHLSPPRGEFPLGPSDMRPLRRRKLAAQPAHSVCFISLGSVVKLGRVRLAPAVEFVRRRREFVLDVSMWDSFGATGTFDLFYQFGFGRKIGSSSLGCSL